MNDTELRLREALYEGAELIEPPRDFDDRVVRRVMSRRARRRNAIVTTSGALVAVLVVAAVLIARRNSHDSAVVVTDSPTTTASIAQSTPTTSAAETTVAEARGQLSLDGPRQRTQAVWTGEEIVIFGGYIEARNAGVSGNDRALGDGAAFNPSTRTWRVLAPSPLSATADNTLSVWAGDRAVFVRGNDVAAWLPQSNQWQKLPAIPGAGASGKLIWTGKEVIAVENNAALRIGDPTWRVLPEPPLRLARADYNWTGSVVLVTGGSGIVQIQQYDPSRNTWDVPPASNIGATATDAAWNGKELIVVNYDNSAAAYDPTLRRWRDLPRVPARFMEHYPTVVATSDIAAVFMAQTIAILNDRDEWTPLPYGDFTLSGQGLVITTDGTIWSIGIDPRDPNGYTGTAFNPAPALVALKSIQVGVATVDLGGYTFQSAKFDGKGPAPETTTARIATPQGSCTVSSTYVGSNTTRTGTPTTIIVAGSREIAARQITATAIEADYTSSDIVRIDCPDAQTTTNVARQLHPPTTPG